jgi:biotin synthase
VQAAGAVLRLLAGKDEMNPQPMTHDDVLRWLLETDETKLEALWQEADRVRKERVGDAVHLRGLIEMSSFCRRDCHYCGIRGSRHIDRYRMTEDEVMDCVRVCVKLEYGTVVLQSGEDPGLTREFITRLIRRIKAETPLAITLSLGERSLGELKEWREAGADRYLLKHETSDPELFRRIHPDCGAARDMTGLPGNPDRVPSSAPNERVELLRQIRTLGYEIGSGVMVGIPGQTFDSLTDDIMLFRELDLEMIGCGPFVAHPDTPLGRLSNDDCRLTNGPLIANSFVPSSDVMTTKVVALVRLVCPDANIPSTTALATINKKGRELGLQRGANVWMPNLTPPKYRAMYEIYPGKARVIDTAERFHQNLLATLKRIGRCPGKGPGGRRPRQAGRV